MMKKSVKILTILLMFICLFANSNVLAQSNIISVTNVKMYDKTDTTIVNNVNYNNLSISSDVVFHSINDYVTYEIVLKNNTNKDYTLESLTTTSNNKYIKYNCENCSDIKFSKKSEIKILLKEKYTTQVQDMNKRNQNMKFDLQLRLIDEDGNYVNPQTGDNINTYVYLALISSAFLLTILFILKANNKKSNAKIIPVLILLLLPTVVTASIDSINVKFHSKTELFDRVVLTIIEGSKEKHTLINYGTKVELPTEHEEKVGYNFVGWIDKNGNMISDGQIADKDISILPKYTPIEYTITVDLDGGSVDIPTTYTVESIDFNLPKPTREGFTFIGWTGSNGNIPQEEVIITKGSIGNRTYIANWEIVGSGPTMDLPNETDTHKGIAYLNPTDLETYCYLENSINTQEAEIGCKRFYIFDDTGDTYKMILDRNTTSYVAWNSDEENSNSEMREVLEALENDTEGWIGNPRLITANEVASAIDSTIWSSSTATQTDGMYFGSRGMIKYDNQSEENKARQRSYHWLFDYTNGCTDNGCSIADNSTKGYWTSTPLVNDEFYVWMVYRTGYLGNSDATNDDIFGVRPVIELSKSIFE